MADKQVVLFLAEGFEEVEALATVDILRRGGIHVTIVSVTGDYMVKSRNNIWVKADRLLEKIEGYYDALILPGGKVVDNYLKAEGLKELIAEHNVKNKLIAAICAAPTYLDRIGILNGKTAVCFPSMEGNLKNAVLGSEIVEVSGNVVTSKCPATAISFAFKLLEILGGREKRDEVYDEMHFELLVNPCK